MKTLEVSQRRLRAHSGLRLRLIGLRASGALRVNVAAYDNEELVLTVGNGEQHGRRFPA